MKKPRRVRLALAVPDDVNLVLNAISLATNTPKTHLITELLVESMPVFQMVLAAIEDAKEGRQQAAYDAMAGIAAKVHVSVKQVDIDLDAFKSKHLGDSE